MNPTLPDGSLAEPKNPFRSAPQFRSASSSRLRKSRRRGATTVFGLFLTTSLIAVMAMTLDLENISVARNEMRRSADAAAMSACWQLFDDRVARTPESELYPSVFAAAAELAAGNEISKQAPLLDEQGRDVEIGYWNRNVPGQLDTSDPASFNAVRIVLRREDSMNGKIPLFFARVLGVEGQPLRVTSTAAMMRCVQGFESPTLVDQTLNILPIALDLQTWEAVLAGTTPDAFSANGSGVASGQDGMHECNLYPQGTGLPGNRGTVDIGGADNSTADLSRQILQGISRNDLQNLGKPLQFDAEGDLRLNGDTGISAGIKDELAAIVGQTRIIPIYDAAGGNGNNANFTIVRFEGVRILEVKLTGPKDKKRVLIQPAVTLARGAIIAEGGQTPSQYLYSPVMLVE